MLPFCHKKAWPLYIRSSAVRVLKPTTWLSMFTSSAPLYGPPRVPKSVYFGDGGGGAGGRDERSLYTAGTFRVVALYRAGRLRLRDSTATGSGSRALLIRQCSQGLPPLETAAWLQTMEILRAVNKTTVEQEQILGSGQTGHMIHPFRATNHRLVRTPRCEPPGVGGGARRLHAGCS